MYNRIVKNNYIKIGGQYEVKEHLKYPKQIHIAIEDNKINDEIDYKELERSIIEDARKQAELIIKESKYEATAIVEKTQVECNQIVESAIEESKASGYNDGFEEGKNQFNDLFDQINHFKEEMDGQYSEFTNNIESNAVKMILEISKKVISQEINLNKEYILSLVKQAFAKCTNNENCLLKVSASDYETIIENKNVLMSSIEGLDNLNIKQELSFPKGSCIIETSFGTIDAGIETKLRKIEETFNSIIKSN